MNIEGDKWYDLKECLPEPVSGVELDALLDMVSSDGWKVFKRMKDIEARSSACAVLNPTSPLERCEAGRALWYAQCQDVQFDVALREAAKNAEGYDSKEDLDFVGNALADAPIPSAADVDKSNTINGG